MSSPSPVPGVVSFEEARRIVEEQAAKVVAQSGGPHTEVVDLLTGQGRALAEPIVADRDFPPFPRATRDGYAVRAADVAKTPVQLAVIGEIKAGDLPDRLTVDRGQAASIMTGAALPSGADAVVMVEYTSAEGQFVEVQRSVSAYENFVPRGAEARAGQLLLDRGRRLDHAAIAIAASVGKSRVEVFRKPRVAVLSTGDEVVGIDAAPGPAQIRNSNSYSLAAQIDAAGGEPVRLPIAPDEPRQLRTLIEEGLGYDLLLLTGGVSMGKYDLVEQVLVELKAEFYFTGAKIQPGKPVVFGSCGAGAPARVRAAKSPPAQAATPASPKKYFFGLPGNPVSTMVTFELFVRPMVEALAGTAPQPLIFPRARLKSEIRTKTGLKRFLPAVLSGEFETAEVELARWQGSGDVAALAAANCYIVIPPDCEKIEAGEWVPLLMRYPVHNG
jgi:molybdopterin molybdotransferase